MPIKPRSPKGNEYFLPSYTATGWQDSEGKWPSPSEFYPAMTHTDYEWTMVGPGVLTESIHQVEANKTHLLPRRDTRPFLSLRTHKYSSEESNIHV
jgi:hypothetical protein